MESDAHLSLHKTTTTNLFLQDLIWKPIVRHFTNENAGILTKEILIKLEKS